MNRWFQSVATMALLAGLLTQCSETRLSLRHFHNSEDGVTKCSRCPPGWGVSQACEVGTDTRCVQCYAGGTYNSHHSYHSPCWSCSRCGVGLYEAQPCTPTKDTVCDDCTRLLDQPEMHRTRDNLVKCAYLYLR